MALAAATGFLVALFVFAIRLGFWKASSDLFKSPIHLRSLEITGQMKTIVVSDKSLLAYFENCFDRARNRSTGSIENGVLYNLTLRFTDQSPYKTYVIVAGSGKTLFVAVQSLSTKLGLGDATLMEIPLLDPIPQDAKNLIIVLLSAAKK
jgi:hypothetical protein